MPTSLLDIDTWPSEERHQGDAKKTVVMAGVADAGSGKGDNTVPPHPSIEFLCRQVTRTRAASASPLVTAATDPRPGTTAQCQCQCSVVTGQRMFIASARQNMQPHLWATPKMVVFLSPVSCNW